MWLSLGQPLQHRTILMDFSIPAYAVMPAYSLSIVTSKLIFLIVDSSWFKVILFTKAVSFKNAVDIPAFDVSVW